VGRHSDEAEKYRRNAEEAEKQAEQARDIDAKTT
jgi:hypothetical protein